MTIKNVLRQAICFGAAVSALMISVNAQISEQSCGQRGQTVTFEGLTDAPDGVVTYVICEGIGENGSTFGGENLYFIGEAEPAADGKFSIQFSLEESGNYVLRMKDADFAILDKPIQYLDEEDNATALVAEINTGDEASIKKAMDGFNFSFDGQPWYEIKNNDMENWIADCVKKQIPYADAAAFQKDFNIFAALYRINSAQVTTIASECGKYAALLGIEQNTDVTKFINRATEAQKRALVQSLSKAPATDVDMLVSAISEALTSGTSQGGGSGGNGSGSGSGGGSSFGGGFGSGLVGVQAPLEYADNSSSGNPAQDQAGFYDMSQAEWARAAVETLAEKGIISGDGDGRFRPNDGVTREEFVKMVLMAVGISSEGETCTFLDVFEDDWFYSYVGAAQKTGIINGISNDMFGVGLNISRQDAAAIINRAVEYTGKSFETKNDPVEFTDREQIADYAEEAVQQLCEYGIISGMGDGTFCPQEICTRAEAAKMIFGLL